MKSSSRAFSFAMRANPCAVTTGDVTSKPVDPAFGQRFRLAELRAALRRSRRPRSACARSSPTCASSHAAEASARRDCNAPASPRRCARTREDRRPSAGVASSRRPSALPIKAFEFRNVRVMTICAASLASANMMSAKLASLRSRCADKSGWSADWRRPRRDSTQSASSSTCLRQRRRQCRRIAVPAQLGAACRRPRRARRCRRSVAAAPSTTARRSPPKATNVSIGKAVIDQRVDIVGVALVAGKAGIVRKRHLPFRTSIALAGPRRPHSPRRRLQAARRCSIS